MSDNEIRAAAKRLILCEYDTDDGEFQIGPNGERWSRTIDGHYVARAYLSQTQLSAEQREAVEQIGRAYRESTQGEWSVPHLSTADDEDAQCHADSALGLNLSPEPCRCPYVLCDHLMGSICDVSVDNGLPVGEGGNDSPPLPEAKANGRFIATAHNLWPLLEPLLTALATKGTK